MILVTEEQAKEIKRKWEEEHGDDEYVDSIPFFVPIQIKIKSDQFYAYLENVGLQDEEDDY